MEATGRGEASCLSAKDTAVAGSKFKLQVVPPGRSGKGRQVGGASN